MDINYFFDFLRHSKLLVGILVVFLLAIFIIPLFLPKPPQPLPTPTPQPAASYPLAQEQPFPSLSGTSLAFVTIITNPSGAEVTIDKQALNNQNQIAPINISPFTLQNVPLGNHVLQIFKLGYLVKTQEITVKNENNRFEINLDKAPDENAMQLAIKKMPVSTENYYIEYLDAIKKVQVIVRKAPFQTNKQLAIDWFKTQGISNPESVGVEFYPALNVKP